MNDLEKRTFAILKHLHGIDRPVMAEIGVGRSFLSKKLLVHPTLHLHMVDYWLPADQQPQAYRDTGDYFANRTPSHCDKLLWMAEIVARAHPGRVTFHHAKSVDAARDIKDGSLDLVFIDDDHSYEGCKLSIASWMKKVKHGGWLGGHDYYNHDAPRSDFTGVDRAVDELSRNFGIKIEEDLDFTWWVKR